MENVLIRDDGVPCDAVEECLQHALAARNHRRVLLRLRLLHGIVTNRLLRWNWRNDERRVEFHEAEPKRLEFGIAVVSYGRLNG